jgi:hypothetical protein
MNEADKEKYNKILIEVETYGPEQLDQVVKDLKIKSPDTGNELS